MKRPSQSDEPTNGCRLVGGVISCEARDRKKGSRLGAVEATAARHGTAPKVARPTARQSPAVNGRKSGGLPSLSFFWRGLRQNDRVITVQETNSACLAIGIGHKVLQRVCHQSSGRLIRKAQKRPSLSTNSLLSVSDQGWRQLTATEYQRQRTAN